MEIKKTKDQKVQYFFEITASQLDQYCNLVYEKIQPKVEVKGFRKGNVPRKIFENRFGKDNLYADALEHIVENKYQETLEKVDFETIGSAKLIDLDEKKMKSKQDFTFGLEFMVKPLVKLNKYLELEIAKNEITVDDDEIEKTITDLLSKESFLTNKSSDILELGDVAILDFEGFLDEKPFPGGKGNNYNLEIGSKQFIDGFEQQMIGMKRGEEKKITVTFPKNYQEPNLSGKEVYFQVILHNIQTKKMPSLNDGWVKKLNYHNVNNVSELKNHIKENLLNQKKQNKNQETEEKIIEQLIKNNEVEVPQEAIQQEIEMLKNNFFNELKQIGFTIEEYLKHSQITQEEFEVNLSEQALKNIKYSLIVEAIALQEKITVPETKIEQHYQELSNHHQVSVDKLKKNPNMNEKETNKWLLTKEVLDFIIKNAVDVSLNKQNITNEGK